MSLHFFQCPICGEDFSCKAADHKDLLYCPNCGRKGGKRDFLQLFFCPACEKLFREKEKEEQELLTCPHCGVVSPKKEAFNLKSSAGEKTLSGVQPSPSFPPPRATLFSKGEIFDKYRIIRLLGRGGMAEVYLAEHMILGHSCALKCLSPLHSSSAGSPMAKKRFIREAKLARTIAHPNIVSISDVGCEESSGIIFIVMEYIEGKTLAELTGTHFTEKELLETALQMAKALAALEKHRIIHRDIKPSNIMRQNDGTVKLMDLGIAKSGDPAGTGEYPLTMDKAIFGTPAYASPEQCRDSRSLDCRSDIYSLGATLYHLAAGKGPYDGTTPLEMICNVLEKTPQPLEQLREDLSKETCQLISSMMAKDPDSRPGNARILLQKIQRLKKGPMGAFREKLRESRLSIFLFLLFFLLFSGGYFFFSAHNMPPPGKGVTKIISFQETDFRNKGEKRTLSNRLKEVQRIIAFLEKRENRTLFHSRRLLMYRERENMLFSLLQEKSARRKQKKKIAAAPEHLKSIAYYISNRVPPFRDTPRDRQYGIQLLTDLCNKQLDPNTEFTDYLGIRRSLLSYAANGTIVPQLELFRTLIREGADIDIPLPELAEANLFIPPRINFLEELLRAGRNDVDHFRQTPILPGCFEKRKSFSHNYMIFHSCNWELAEFLVDSNCMTEVQDRDGKNIAHHAASWDKAPLLEKLLLGNPAIFTQKDKLGLTPWHYAVRNNALQAIKILEMFRVPPLGITGKDHAQKELLLAIHSGDLSKAQKALEKGADPAFIYAEGLDALQNSIQFRRFAIMELLLKRGTGIRNNEAHMSPLELAIRTRQPRIFKRLLDEWQPPRWQISSGGRIEYLPHRIVCSCHMDPAAGKEFLEILLARSWRINDAPANGITALQCALHHPNLHGDLLRYLLQKGADPYQKNQRGFSAFQAVKNPVHLSILNQYK